MTQKSKGSRLGIGEPHQRRLDSFREAILGAPEREVLKAALREFIDKELAQNPGVKERFDAIEKRKREENGDRVRLVKSDD